MNVRIKLRKTQSLVPLEKVLPETISLEIIGDNIEKIPDLGHLHLCKSVSLQCPELKRLPVLPENLVTLKIKSGRFIIDQLPEKLEILKISHLNLENLDSVLSWPIELKNADFSHNQLSHLPASFLELKSISRLSLDGNRFSTLPKDIYLFKNLNHLSIDNNPLEDQEKNELFQKLGIWF